MKGLINTISGRVYTLLGARAIHGQVKCLSKGKNSLLVVVEHPYPLPELSGLCMIKVTRSYNYPLVTLYFHNTFCPCEMASYMHNIL